MTSHSSLVMDVGDRAATDEGGEGVHISSLLLADPGVNEAGPKGR